MFYEEQRLFQKGDKVYLRKTDSVVESVSGTERIHECRIVNFIDPDMLKLGFVNCYDEAWMPSLDSLYEITVRTEEDTFRSRGRIIERFRDEDGIVCVFRLTDSFSLKENREFISINSELDCCYKEQDGEDKGGLIVELSMNRASMETDEYIEDGKALDIMITLSNGRSISGKARVLETLRLRTGKYESRLKIFGIDIGQQKELAVWMLNNSR